MLTKDKIEEINELVKNFKDGNLESLDVLYMKMYKAIFCSLKKYTDNEELIKDAIEDTFFELYKKPKFQIQYKNCYNLILKIAKNRVLNLIKHDKKYKYLDDDDNFINNLEAKSSRYEGFVEWKLVLDNLPLQDKELFYLRSIKKYKFKKIAKILKISERSVKRKYKNFKHYVEEILKNEK